jgi:hypothetical protein
MAESKQKSSGVTVRDVPVNQYINALAQHLKKSGKIELPAWHDLVKTSTARELPPQNPDWFYVRCGKNTIITQTYYYWPLYSFLINDHCGLIFFFFFHFIYLIINSCFSSSCVFTSWFWCWWIN